MGPILKIDKDTLLILGLVILVVFGIFFANIFFEIPISSFTVKEKPNLNTLNEPKDSSGLFTHLDKITNQSVQGFALAIDKTSETFKNSNSP